jgi:tyrosine-protein kinase Etk/Wzc
MNQTSPFSPSPRQQQPQEVHLSEYIGVILRRRKTFLIAFLAVFLGVAIYTFIMTPIYEATATLHVKDEKAKSGVLGELSLLASNNTIGAEIEILTSRTNAEQVVKRLHLDWQVENMNKGMIIKVLDFASTAKVPAYQIEVTGAGTYTLKEKGGKLIGSGKVGQLLKGEGVSLVVGELSGKPGDSCQLRLLPFNGVVAGLRGAIKAKELGKKTDIVTIAFKSNDPQYACDVVNTLIQTYLEQSVAFKTEEASRTVSFVDEQLKGVRQELDKAEADLQGYKSSSGVVKLDTEAEELIRKFSQTERDRAAVTLQKKQMEFALASLKDTARKGGTYSPAAMRDDPLVAGMATRLAELEVQKRALLTDSTKEHPAVKALQDQIDEVQRKIQATYETALSNLGKEEMDIAKRLASYEGTLKRLPAAERDLARFMRVAKVNADIFTFLLQKHEEARIAQAATISNIKIVDPAIKPDWPIKPQKKKYILLGFVVGLMLGFGLAFFQEYLDDTIKDAEHAKRAVGLPLLAVIPFIPRRETEKGGNGSALITQQEPKSVVAEAFRSLRTSLHFSAINRDKKIILLTSTFPGEGKSTISANLANTLSQTGARVLIVDCDLRRSFLHDKFRCDKVPGLAELLTGDSDFTTVKHHTAIPNLDLVTAGTTPPNPAELLGSEAMRGFLTAQRDNYDHIVIDAPPVLAVTDAPVLTAMADMVLVVLEAGRVPLKAAQRMREMLTTVQAPVAGLVVNDKTGKGESYGYYGGGYYRYGYGYGYGYYGDEDSAAKSKKSWWKRLMRE